MYLVYRAQNSDFLVFRTYSMLFSYNLGKVVRLWNFDLDLRSFAVEGQSSFAVDQEDALVRLYKIGKK
ncbi:MAG: hypothetical protein CO090_06060 [Acidobacteria bacterium CG_4_9_14_3_um_filter_49_7]|nr:MAG: hypothetical protein CO090_06060 [Acidobacteria bacterium CG_4_9_14_3_um_filter_49_7]